MKINKLNILLFLLLPVFVSQMPAQENFGKQVIVFGDYKPFLSDAYRINSMPVMADTFERKIITDYEIRPVKLRTGHIDLRPIKPAKLLPESVPTIYRSKLIMGVGNYWTPYLEFTSSHIRSEEYTYNVWIRNHSSFGNVRLDNDKKVYAGFSDTDVKLDGKKIFDDNLLKAAIGFDNHLVHQYGYNQEIDTIYNFDKEKIKQMFSNINVKAAFKSIYLDSSHLNYDILADYNYLFDNHGFNENIFDISSILDKRFGKNEVGLKASIGYFSRNKTSNLTYFDNTVIHISPYLARVGDEWRFKAGFETVYDNEQYNFNIYPNIYMRFHAADVYVIPFFGIKGKHQTNSYLKLSRENKFIIPGLHTINTRYPAIIFGGIKSHITPEISLKVEGSYSMFENMYFYVNNHSDSIGNTFNVKRDDGEVLNLSLEGTYWYSKSLGFVLKGNYYSYTLDSLEYAWHKPDFDITFSSHYNLKNKIIVNLDMFIIGTRHYLNLTGKAEKISPFFDLNLGAEYMYSNRLSVFLMINNLTASRYYMWNQYPGQRFNALIGFKYTL